MLRVRSGACCIGIFPEILGQKEIKGAYINFKGLHETGIVISLDFKESFFSCYCLVDTPALMIWYDLVFLTVYAKRWDTYT